MSPYVAMGNNPVSIVDPAGDEIFTAMAVGAAIGVIANGITNVVNGQNFFANAGMAVAMGAFGGGMAGGAAGVGAGMLKGGLSVGSSYLPAANIPLGENMSLSISPSLFLGSGGLGIGANFGWSYSSDHLDFGMSLGVTAWSNHMFTNSSFLETRVGYGVGVGGKDFKLGFGHTDFSGGGIGQATGYLSAYGKGWSVMYENDWVFSGAGMADNGDRWRTTGVGVSVGDFSAYMNLVTGDPGLEERESRMIGGRETYTSGTSDKYRLGMIQVGYKGFHGGVNSENVRDFFQNKLAHGNGNRYPVFRKLNNSWFFAGGYRTNNPYTAW